MPFSPRQALARSPKAPLSHDEADSLSELLIRFDSYLSTEWMGTICQIQQSCTMKVMAAFQRAYEEKGWETLFQAIDGQTAKAAELIAAGAVCPFRVTMIPKWKEEQHEELPLIAESVIFDS